MCLVIAARKFGMKRNLWYLRKLASLSRASYYMDRDSDVRNSSNKARDSFKQLLSTESGDRSLKIRNFLKFTQDELTALYPIE